jgi:hypothetical protein
MDFNEHIDSPSLAQSIIEVIYENADAFPREPNFFAHYSEFSKTVELMTFLINNKIQDQSMHEVLENALARL